MMMRQRSTLFRLNRHSFEQITVSNQQKYANRVITSIDFAKQERILRALKKTPWDIIIVDEAHYLAESGSATHPLRTDRSRFGETIGPLCDGSVNDWIPLMPWY